MLPRIIDFAAIILIAIIALGWLVPRERKSQQSLGRPWEIAPIIGFLGAVLLAIGFVEADRRLVVESWRWGVVFGILLSVCFGLFMLYRANRIIADPNETGWRAWLRVAQSYGLFLLIAILSVIIAVRVVGPLLEVFIAGALGTLVIVLAAGVFLIQWRRRGLRTTSDKQ
jgi:hypothetical protein